MAHWRDGVLLGFDLETDSPDPCDAQIIQVALSFVTPGRGELVERRWLVVPRRPIPPGATAVHGISTETAQRDGEPVARVLDELATELERWDDSNVLCGHNISYDLTVTDREFGRVADAGLTVRGPVVDTLLCDKNADRWRPGERTLKSQCAHYGIDPGRSHDAGADVAAVLRLAWKLSDPRRRWPRGRWAPKADEVAARKVLAHGDADELHVCQIEWHEAGQRGLAEYWRTPKAIDKTWEKVARGDMTEDEARAWIAELPSAADRVEAGAVGCWPMVPRIPVTT